MNSYAKDVSFDENVNDANQYIATKWDQFNRSVDTFFTNKRSPEKNRSSIFVYSSLTKNEGSSIETDYDFQLRIDLPNTTQKLKIVIEKEQDEISNILTDTTVSKKKATSRVSRTPKAKDARYTVGTNFLLKQSKYFVSFVHFGIRLDMPLNPSAKLDLKKDFKTKYVNIGIGQKFNYYRQEGFQEISQLIFNKKLTSMIQSDLVNSLVWSDETDKFTLRHNLVLSHDLGEERAMAYSIGATASFSPTYYYSNYDASISYRQLLFKDWFYGTLAVGVDFAKENRFNDEKYIQIRFDVFFRE